MCGSVVRLGVMSYLGEMNGFRVPRPLVCNTLGEMNGLGLHVTSVGRIHLSAGGPRRMVWKGVRRRLRLVSFRGGTLGGQSTQAVAIRRGGGKASPSVSIFSRAPLCPNTCRHCRNKPCDIATDHDDHICYNCEQSSGYCFLNVFRTQNLPICDLWCQECATQRCCTRGSHQYHLCMQCERRGVVFLAPVGGEDPWAANDD